jgi:hypothetical protein
MPTYKVVYKEFHQLIISKIQEFDTSDQDAWDAFRSNAELNGIDIENYPQEAPSDPQIWFDLISELPTEDYAETEEDCWTMNNGGYDTSYELEDEDGNTL